MLNSLLLDISYHLSGVLYDEIFMSILDTDTWIHEIGGSKEEIHILLFYFIPFNSTLVAINICPEISRHINQFHIIIRVILYTRCFSNTSHVDESWKGFCSWHGLGWVIYQQTSNNSLEGSFFVACEYSSLRSFTW